MNDTQKKLYGLLESYLEYCKEYGYIDFKVWCDGNIDTVDEESVMYEIYQEVNFVAGKLFR